MPKERFEHTPNLLIDLLDPEENQLFNLQPRALVERISILKPEIEWVIIDEIQKAPKLMDIVHQRIESTRFRFALTGSSARKLGHGAANLLAGRAFVQYLLPLTAREIGAEFLKVSALKQWVKSRKSAMSSLATLYER